MVITVINLVLLVVAIFTPTWVSAISVIVAVFLPDALPMVDEIVGIAVLVRKFLNVKPGSEGKAVVSDVKSSASRLADVSTYNTANLTEKAGDLVQIKTQGAKLLTDSKQVSGVKILNAFDK